MPFVAATFAAAIFVVDAFIQLDIAIAVLYVAVILMSLVFSERRGVIAVSAACFSLTVLAFLVQHTETTSNEAVGRFLVSLAAIAITTFLALRIESTTRALRKQARLLDLTHDAILVRHLDDTIAYWNRGAEKLYGWAAAQAIGRDSRQLTQTVLPAPYDLIRRRLLSAGYWEGEVVHTRRDGTQVTVASRWSLQRDDRGQPVSILESNTDIEERKQAQEKLAHAQAELAHVARVATLGELTASIAHEVNQPLAAIVTSAEACLRWLEGTANVEALRRGLDRIIRDGKRASDVVRRLRALARKEDFDSSPVDINGAIADAVQLVQRDVARHRITLGLALATRLPTIQGDRVQLQQVIINLLMNAIQAMTGVDHLRTLKVTSRQQDNEIIVTVEDNGPGFSAEDGQRLFKAFFTTKPTGMGIGLSISRSIVEAHHGRIWASRNDDGGATFAFALPIATGRSETGSDKTS